MYPNSPNNKMRSPYGQGPPPPPDSDRNSKSRGQFPHANRSLQSSGSKKGSSSQKAPLSAADQAWQRPLGTWVPKKEKEKTAATTGSYGGSYGSQYGSHHTRQGSPERDRGNQRQQSPSRQQTPRGQSPPKSARGAPQDDNLLRQRTEQRVLEELFQRFDVNRQGFLTAVEIGEAMRSIMSNTPSGGGGGNSSTVRVTPDAVMRVTSHLLA